MPSESSYALIEGDWKDFRFRRITDADKKAVFEHLAQNYCKDEAISNLLGWSQEYADDINRVGEVVLKDGLSFLCEERSTGKIAGVRITANHTPELGKAIEKLPIHTRSGQMFFKFIGDIMTRADVPGKLGIQNWAEFWFASTDPQFRNQGLVNEMYDRSIRFLVAENFKHVSVGVTSPWTRHATLKRGFKEIARMEFDELVDNDGKKVFRKEDLTPEHYALILMKTL